MQLCMTIEGQEGVSWNEWVALACAAESAGLDGFFRSDHYSAVLGAQTGALDAWSTIAALGAVTKRIRLGTLVSPVTFRHPSVLARMVASADEISGGRVEVGIGTGWYEHEHTQNGFPFPSVAERFEHLAEQLEIVVRSWSDEPIDFHGKHYWLTKQQALPKPVQRPHPPIIIGGLGKPRSIEVAVQYANEYNMLGGLPGECRVRRAVLDEACRRAGRDPATMTLSIMGFAVLGKTEAQTALSRERGFELLPNMRNAFASGATDFSGTVDALTARLRIYQQVGVGRIYLNLFDRRNLESVELMGKLTKLLED